MNLLAILAALGLEQWHALEQYRDREELRT